MTKTPLGLAGQESDAEITIGANGSSLVADGIEGTAVRFGANGSWDRRFGRRGLLSASPRLRPSGPLRTFRADSVTADLRGRPVMFGGTLVHAQSAEGPEGGLFFGSAPTVVRFSADGRRLDPSFGEGSGYVRGDLGVATPISGVTQGSAIAGVVDSRDRPVFLAGALAEVGGCQGHTTGAFVPEAVVRLTESGEPDTAFGDGDGAAPIAAAGAKSPFLALDSLDQAAVGVGRVGSFAAECGVGTTIHRLGPDGAVLAAFGPEGAREFASMHLALVEPAGGLVLDRIGSRRLVLSRVGPEGEVDAGFGQDGVAIVHLPHIVELHVEPSAVDAEGRILLSGFVGSSIGERHKSQPRFSSFVVARLLPDGEVDRSFGKHGWIFSHVPAPLELISTRGALDAGGRLLVAGIVIGPNERDGGFAVVRYRLGS